MGTSVLQNLLPSWKIETTSSRRLRIWNQQNYSLVSLKLEACLMMKQKVIEFFLSGWIAEASKFCRRPFLQIHMNKQMEWKWTITVIKNIKKTIIWSLIKRKGCDEHDLRMSNLRSQRSVWTWNWKQSRGNGKDVMKMMKEEHGKKQEIQKDGGSWRVFVAR